MPSLHTLEHTLAHVVVVLTALYLIALGIAALFIPSRAARFLGGFAHSAGAHYAELVVRLLVGGAFIVNAPLMQFAEVFNVFGWVLVVTSAVLLAIPWRLHRRFAEKAVPRAMRYVKLVGLASLAFGIFVLVATLRVA